MTELRKKNLWLTFGTFWTTKVISRRKKYCLLLAHLGKSLGDQEKRQLIGSVVKASDGSIQLFSDLKSHIGSNKIGCCGRSFVTDKSTGWAINKWTFDFSFKSFKLAKSKEQKIKNTYQSLSCLSRVCPFIFASPCFSKKKSSKKQAKKVTLVSQDKRKKICSLKWKSVVQKVAQVQKFWTLKSKK